MQSGCGIRKDLMVLLNYSSSAVMQSGVRVRFVVAEDQLSCCGCCAVAHIVAVLAVLAPNMTFVCMSECLGVGRWWSS